MKKIIALAELGVFILASIGGFGYLMHINEPTIGVAVVLLSVMAFPEMRRAFKELSSVEDPKDE